VGDRRRRRDQGKPQHLGPGLGRRRPDSRMSERVATSERERERERDRREEGCRGRKGKQVMHRRKKNARASCGPFSVSLKVSVFYFSFSRFYFFILVNFIYFLH